VFRPYLRLQRYRWASVLFADVFGQQRLEPLLLFLLLGKLIFLFGKFSVELLDKDMRLLEFVQDTAHFFRNIG